MSNKIDWRKTIDEYIKFEGSSKEFCEDRNITKGQLFYYKKKFLDKGTVFCAIDINKDKAETIDRSNYSTPQNVVAIEFKNSKISMPASETALIISVIKELVKIC